MLVSNMYNSGTKEEIITLRAGSQQRALREEGISAGVVERNKT